MQLREKELEEEELFRLAEELLGLTEDHDADLILNTDAGTAMEIGASGVHLPASGPSPQSVREVYGNQLLIGCSTHSLEEMRASEDADFLTFSPIFSPTSKPGYGPGVGVSALQSAVGATRLPVFALGGITPDKVEPCRETGCAGVAVMSGILAASDVRGAALSYHSAWHS